MNIGDKVKLVDLGNIYSTYTDMFEKLNFKDLNENIIIDFDFDFYKDLEFTIINIAEHLHYRDIILYHISESCTNKELLVGEESIKKI